ncbi:MAG: hypothetical protein HXS52_14135 [Theionarchaea archaeon]|nr:hypothetical protein [Theionarchaea archaeon]
MGQPFLTIVQFEVAMKYYQKAKITYRKACTEDSTAIGAHQVDGDRDFYAQWFHMQLPELHMIDFGFERLWKSDSKRLQYRFSCCKRRLDTMLILSRSSCP